MRVARLKESGKRACYHVMSRVVDRHNPVGTHLLSIWEGETPVEPCP
jgi:hypothetical protein